MHDYETKKAENERKVKNCIKGIESNARTREASLPGEEECFIAWLKNSMKLGSKTITSNIVSRKV
jgi:hypothetical protein